MNWTLREIEQAKRRYDKDYDPYVHPHEHRAYETSDFGWTACIDPDSDHSAACHGNITTQETCFCGASRIGEVNQRYTHFMEWRRVDAEQRPS